MNEVIMLIIYFAIFFIIKVTLLKKIPSDTPAGAIVMACGIFINGAMKNISFLDKTASKSFTLILLLLWIFIAASYINSVFKKNIYETHFKNPIKSFAVGTWVAGTSVAGIAVFQRLPGFISFSRFLFFFNLILWLFCVIVFINNYKLIFNNNLSNKVHGVILLATVSTQSIVVFGCNVYGKRFPELASQLLISLGVIFYFIGFLLIIRRYFFRDEWNIEEDWLNTNCILHGAMSITGLASATSAAISPNVIFIIWIWVIIWFIIVEGIEIYRAFRRINKYGFLKGVGVYDVTQWSRIFTFGMFYAFTMKFNLKLTSLASSIFFDIQHLILISGTWIMVCILIIEGLLFFRYQFLNRKDASV